MNIEIEERVLEVDVEKTIANVGKLAKNGMFETNKEIIRIMTQ